MWTRNHLLLQTLLIVLIAVVAREGAGESYPMRSNGSNACSGQSTEVDFCEVLGPQLLALIGPEIDLCREADLNGDGSSGDDSTEPNGIRDFLFEFGLIQAVLGDPALDFSAGTQAGQVQAGLDRCATIAAFEHNLEQIGDDMDPQWTQFLTDAGIYEGFTKVVSAYVLVGSPGSVGYALSILQELAVEGQTISQDDYAPLPQSYAPLGDADGDGYCNWQEYLEFFDLDDAALYVTAALDPMVTPAGPAQCPEEFPGFEALAYALLDQFFVSDTNGDDGLVADETASTIESVLGAQVNAALRQSHFIQMDKNSDNILTVGELRQQVSESPIHASDQNGNRVISLFEILRTIQLYNLHEYACINSNVDTSEDGYLIGTTFRNCVPHSSDYDPQDWAISLGELLRLVQIYNSSGYFFCPDADPPSEDGYCITLD